MGKRISAKHKIDRRLGVNLWGRSKSPFNSRQTIPGQHGPTARKKETDFGIQLKAKQKLKATTAQLVRRNSASITRKPFVCVATPAKT